MKFDEITSNSVNINTTIIYNTVFKSIIDVDSQGQPLERAR